MKGNLTGLFISGLLHIGLIGWITTVSHVPEKKQVQIKTHQLTVNLFQAEKLDPVVPVTEKKVVAVKKLEKSVPSPVEKTTELVVKKAIHKPIDKPVKPITIAEAKPKVEPAKAIIIAATVQPKPSIKKPKITIEKPKLVKRLAKTKNKPQIKPVKKVEKQIVKVTPKIKPKLKFKKKVVLKPKKKKKILVKRANRQVRKRNRPVKKSVIKRKVLKPVVQARAKPKPRPRVKPRVQVRRVKPQRRPVAKVQRQRAKPVARKVVRRVVRRRPPTVRKHVKTGRVVSRKQVNPKKQVIARKSPNRRHAVRKQVAKTQQAYRKPVQRHRKPAPVKRSAVVNSARTVNLNKQYKSRLHQLIARVTKKNYPKRAKRRNQQGRVRLSFTISHSGTISNIKILKGSNVSVLDKAAIQAIQQASRKLPFLNGMPKKSINLTMTVIYVLG